MAVSLDSANMCMQAPLGSGLVWVGSKWSRALKKEKKKTLFILDPHGLNPK